LTSTTSRRPLLRWPLRLQGPRRDLDRLPERGVSATNEAAETATEIIGSTIGRGSVLPLDRQLLTIEGPCGTTRTTDVRLEEDTIGMTRNVEKTETIETETGTNDSTTVETAYLPSTETVESLLSLRQRALPRALSSIGSCPSTRLLSLANRTAADTIHMLRISGMERR
jgi:hypothetical protein